MGEVTIRQPQVKAHCGERCATTKPLSSGKKSPRQKQRTAIPFADSSSPSRTGKGAVSGAAGGPAEVLRKGSGIKVDGTAGHGLTISTYYIKDAGSLPGKRPPGPELSSTWAEQ
jgi:hypothetical protein